MKNKLLNCLFILLGFCMSLNSQKIERQEYIRKDILQYSSNSCFLDYSVREYDFENIRSSDFQFVTTQKGDELFSIILEKLKKKMPESLKSTNNIFVYIFFDKSFNFLKFRFLIDSCDESSTFDSEVNGFIIEMLNIDLSKYISIYDLSNFNYGNLFRVVRKRDLLD